MKKSLIVIAALILAISVAGCGKKAENTNTTPQQTAQSDASGAYENGSSTPSTPITVAGANEEPFCSAMTSYTPLNDWSESVLFVNSNDTTTTSLSL